MVFLYQVGTDILEEQITAFEDFVQSMDVAAFNKIWKYKKVLIKCPAKQNSVFEYLRLCNICIFHTFLFHRCKLMINKAVGPHSGDAEVSTWI